jgi:hypothetical protein
MLHERDWELAATGKLRETRHSLHMVEATAAYAAGSGAWPSNGGGLLFVTSSNDIWPREGHRRLTSRLLRACCVVPSVYLDNAVTVYMDAKECAAKGHAVTPLKLLRVALGRRLKLHDKHDTVFRHTPACKVGRLPQPRAIAAALEHKSDLDKLLSAARDNGLAVVVCVDGLTSASTETWYQLHSLQQSFHARVFAADDSKALIGRSAANSVAGLQTVRFPFFAE